MDAHGFLLALERDRLVAENQRLQALAMALAERVAVQAEILARTAERSRGMGKPGGKNAPGSAGEPPGTTSDT